MLNSIHQSVLVNSNAIQCPVCHTVCDSPPLYSYTASQAAAYFCPEMRNLERYQRLKNCIQRLWQSDSSVILQCQNCGFGFGYPFIGGDEEFYQILHEQKGYPTWRWDYNVALQEALEPMQTGKLLEIGAGAGIFLKKIRQSWDCYATEGSESTRKDLKSLGIQVFSDLDLTIESHQQSFDVVVLFQVLEHISDFHSILDDCRKLLRVGGKIVITVPDGEAMIRQEKITGCPDMPPNHINKWTPNSLAIALQQHGFEAQTVIFEPSSWKNFRGYLHLKIIAEATNPRSLASQIYRIKNKKIRAPLLAVLGISAMFKMLPYFRDLQKGGAFAMIGTLKDK